MTADRLEEEVLSPFPELLRVRVRDKHRPRQAGKITRVEQWLQTMGKTLADFERSWFYSDSPNDLPLMEVVTDPVATNPSDKLRAVATERNWVVIDLFADMMDSKS